jgi:hypothetical protein
MAQLRPAPLTQNEIEKLQDQSGVYRLYHADRLIYIGKADKSLPVRLSQHHKKISGRRGIDITEMTFECLYVEEDLAAVAREKLLIDRHRANGDIPWNYNGFGNNDPGRERDTTKVKDGHFDSLYPVDLDWRCVELSGHYIIGDLLKQFKAMLPYNLRYESGDKAQSKQPADYQEAAVRIPAGGAPVSAIFDAVIDALPTGWQITALPGYVIMYRETKKYPSATRVYRKQT